MKREVKRFLRLCTIDGCENKHEAKGYCKKHYKAYHKYGDPLAEPKRKAYPKRKPVKDYEENHKVIHNKEHKLCSDCDEWFPMNEEYFYKNDKNKTDGFNPYCKECTKKRSWKWQKDNWDKMLIHFKKMNAKPENKEKHRQLYWERKEEGYYERYYEENKDKFKRYNQNRRLNKKHKISKQEWADCKEYFNNECAYCGMPHELHVKFHNEDLHREHVDANGANDLSNCIPSCRICNVRKKLISLTDWYNENNQNYSEERLFKIYKWLFEDYKIYKEEIE